MTDSILNLITAFLLGIMIGGIAVGIVCGCVKV